jgi:hypothetical protein
MKTFSYNPSQIELDFAQAIKDLKKELQAKIHNHKILDIQNNMNADNPTVTFKLEDKDGDKHEVVLKVIQRLDE